MGLDVYLEKCADIAAAHVDEERYEEASSAAWTAVGDFDKLSQEQKDAYWAANKELAASFGITDYSHKSRTKIMNDSSLAPEHYFKVGYFRSSYNGSGFNSVMRKLGLVGLDEIFKPDHDAREFFPDWDGARKRLLDAIEKYEAHLSSPIGKYRTLEISPMFEYGVADEKAALDLYAKSVLERKLSPDDGGWSNRDGEFYPGGMKVCAFITKEFRTGVSANPIDRILNRPTIFAIVQKDDDGKPDWYLTAMKIVLETIDYVLAAPDRQHFYLVWSG